MIPTEDFGQLRLKFTDSIQHNYNCVQTYQSLPSKVAGFFIWLYSGYKRRKENAMNTPATLIDKLKQEETISTAIEVYGVICHSSFVLCK